MLDDNDQKEELNQVPILGDGPNIYITLIVDKYFLVSLTCKVDHKAIGEYRYLPQGFHAHQPTSDSVGDFGLKSSQVFQIAHLTLNLDKIRH